MPTLPGTAGRRCLCTTAPLHQSLDGSSIIEPLHHLGYTWMMEDAPAPAPRKSVSLPADLWKKVEDYRFNNRVPTESEAIRRLIELGLKMRLEPPAQDGEHAGSTRADWPDLADAVKDAEDDKT